MCDVDGIFCGHGALSIKNCIVWSYTDGVGISLVTPLCVSTLLACSPTPSAHQVRFILNFHFTLTVNYSIVLSLLIFRVPATVAIPADPVLRSPDKVRGNH